MISIINKNIVKILFLIIISSLIYISGFQNIYADDDCFNINSSGVLTSYTCNDKNVVIPASVTSIGGSAFYGKGLNSVDFSLAVGLTSIGSSAFYSNKIEDIVFPNNIESIGSHAFYDNNLSHIEFLREGQTSIGSSVFSYQNKRSISGLTSVNDVVYGDWVAYDGVWAEGIIGSCFSYVRLSNKTKINGYLDKSFGNNIDCTKDVVIPNGITSISSYSFDGKGLNSVSLPSSLTSIGTYAFRNNNLVSVELPSGLTSIRSYAFYGNNLTSVKFLGGEDGINIGTGAFDYQNGVSTSGLSGGVIYVYGDWTVLPGINSWEQLYTSGCFSYSDEGHVNLVRYLCINEGNVVVPNGVKKIGYQAFYNKGINRVILPSSLETIERNAFDKNNLQNIVFQGNSVNMGNQVFYQQGGVLTNGLSNNSSSSGTTPTSGLLGSWILDFNSKTWFKGQPDESGVSSCYVYSQKSDGSYNLIGYQDIYFVLDNNGYTKCPSNVEIHPSVSEISTNVFFNKKLTSVDFSNATRLKIIGSNAFNNNNLSRALNLPASIQLIDVGAFNKNNISSINIANLSNLQIIGTNAFSENKIEGAITIPNSVHTLDGGAFMNNKITSVNIGSGVSIIGTDAFKNNKITSVNIPNTVSKINNGAFYNNEITSVNIGSGVDYIGRDSFNKNEITSLDIGNAVITIDERAFLDNKISVLNIPKSIKTIGSSAFKGNKIETLNIENNSILEDLGIEVFRNNKIYTLSLPNTLKTIRARAFQNNRLDDVTIPLNVVTIGQSAFDKNYLKWVEFKNTENTKIEPDAFKNQDGVNIVGLSNFTRKVKGKWVIYLDKWGLQSETNGCFIYDEINQNKIVGYRDIYYKTGEFHDCGSDMIIPPGATIIGENAFDSMRLTSVSFENSDIEIIESEAFIRNNITDLHITSTINEIGSGAFSINKISNIVFDKTNIWLGRYPFSPESGANLSGITSSNSSIQSIEVGGTWIINSNAWTRGDFNGCFAYTLGDNTKIVGYDEKSCGRNVVIPSQVKIIRKNAFAGKNIESVDFGSASITSIESGAFARNKLTNATITIPSTISVIEENVFRENNFTSLTIPENITIIGVGAFYKNYLNGGLVIPEGVVEIRANAFDYNYLRTVEFLRDDTTIIGSNSFRNQYIEGRFRGVKELNNITGNVYGEWYFDVLDDEPIVRAETPPKCFVYDDRYPEEVIIGYLEEYQNENGSITLCPRHITIPHTVKAVTLPPIGSYGTQYNILPPKSNGSGDGGIQLNFNDTENDGRIWLQYDEYGNLIVVGEDEFDDIVDDLPVTGNSGDQNGGSGDGDSGDGGIVGGSNEYNRGSIFYQNTILESEVILFDDLDELFDELNEGNKLVDTLQVTIDGEVGKSKSETIAMIERLKLKNKNGLLYKNDIGEDKVLIINYNNMNKLVKNLVRIDPSNELVYIKSQSIFETRDGYLIYIRNNK